MTRPNAQAAPPATQAKARNFEEHEHEPVPQNERRSLASVGLVWLGFPMIFTGAVTGASIVAGLGFGAGMAAILLGNLVLFLYVGALSSIAGRTGRNFPLQAARAFGEKGYVVGSALLSTIVVGWFAVQTGLAGSGLHDLLGWNLVLLTGVAGILYLLAALLGIRALSWIGAISAPLFFALGLYAVVVAIGNHGLGTITRYAG